MHFISNGNYLLKKQLFPSGRHSESPSIDVVSQATIRTNLDSDSDMDVDAELWQNQVIPEELRNLSPHEKKRQDVMNGKFFLFLAFTAL